jgi:hypothetical protein
MAVSLFAIPVAAEAADATCGLKRVASLQMTTLPDGSLAVPATIAGQDVMLSLSFGGASYLYKAAVENLSLRLLRMPENVSVSLDTEHVANEVNIPEFKIGNVTTKDLVFIVLAEHKPSAPNIVGHIAPDILSSFDIEYDFSTMTMNLFLQDHCAGKVVYWASSYAAVPLKVDKAGHPSALMQLDGKPISVGFQPDLDHGEMALATAKRIFGLDETSAEIVSVRGDKGIPVSYRYPFKTLSADGVTIGNPKIDVKPNLNDCLPDPIFGVASAPDGLYRRPTDTSNIDTVKSCLGESELTLGLAEIRKLHLYFAFKEKMLYVTPASTPRAQ